MVRSEIAPHRKLEVPRVELHPGFGGWVRKKKAPGSLTPGAFHYKDCSLCVLYVRRLLAFGALRDVEGNLLAFLEGLEALHLDGREVREEVFAAVVGRDEPVTLRVIEPLHSSGCHSITCLLLNGWSPAHRSDRGPARLTGGDAESLKPNSNALFTRRPPECQYRGRRGENRARIPPGEANLAPKRLKGLKNPVRLSILARS